MAITGQQRNERVDAREQSTKRQYQCADRQEWDQHGNRPISEGKYDGLGDPDRDEGDAGDQRRPQQPRNNRPVHGSPPLISGRSTFPTSTPRGYSQTR